MANRHTLCPQNIEQFKEYLLSNGYVIQAPVGYYEVLRATHKERKHPIIVYRRLSSNGGGELVHYSVLDRDMSVVKNFFMSRKGVRENENGI